MNYLNRSLMILGLISITGVSSLPALSYEHRGGWRQHPRRNEVMRRDGNLDRKIYRDRGHLNGNYKSLMGQDKALRQQTRADFKANGGYLTKPQQRQLNQEENGLRREVRHDQ